jgi:hypothetical protein
MLRANMLVEKLLAKLEPEQLVVLMVGPLP